MVLTTLPSHQRQAIVFCSGNSEPNDNLSIVAGVLITPRLREISEVMMIITWNWTTSCNRVAYYFPPEVCNSLPFLEREQVVVADLALYVKTQLVVDTTLSSNAILSLSITFIWPKRLWRRRQSGGLIRMQLHCCFIETNTMTMNSLLADDRSRRHMTPNSIVAVLWHATTTASGNHACDFLTKLLLHAHKIADWRRMWLSHDSLRSNRSKHSNCSLLFFLQVFSYATTGDTNVQRQMRWRIKQPDNH